MKSAFARIITALARRDHSERELIKKLVPHHDAEEIYEAIEKVRKLGYLKDPQVLAESFAKSLGRRGKGANVIKKQLRAKGLPNVSLDEGRELAKAKNLVLNQLEYHPPYTFEQKKKISRFLTNRGYWPQVISKVLSERGTHDE